MSYKKETRIDRHRTIAAASATLPFLVGFLGGILFHFSDVANWICFTMIGVGATVGGICMGLSHKRIALGPIVYHWKDDPEKLCVIVDNGSVWDKPLHRPLTWQRVIELFPGVYLLMGESFKARQSQMERSWDLFHPSVSDTDEETSEDS